jgi:hypothetical protein
MTRQELADQSRTEGLYLVSLFERLHMMTPEVAKQATELVVRRYQARMRRETSDTALGPAAPGAAQERTERPRAKVAGAIKRLELSKELTRAEASRLILEQFTRDAEERQREKLTVNSKGGPPRKIEPYERPILRDQRDQWRKTIRAIWPRLKRSRNADSICLMLHEALSPDQGHKYTDTEIHFDLRRNGFPKTFKPHGKRHTALWEALGPVAEGILNGKIGGPSGAAHLALARLSRVSVSTIEHL